MIIIASREEKELLQRLRTLDADDKSGPLHAAVVALKKQISDLEIQKSQKQEEHDKQERELRHMIGLEKKRQEFEIQQAKSETSLKVREENLAADKERFANEMKFQNDRFTTEVKYLKDMIGEILGRLPTVTVDKRVK
jgi:hypothetical protein